MRGQSVAGQVYEGILKDILDGEYGANSVLNEKTLMGQYQVSKTSLREALVQLCSEGILNNIPRFGYQIAAITPQEIVESIEFRKLIEIGALERCFHRITPAQLEELKAMNEAAVSIAHNKDTKVHWQKNQEFHRKLCSFCENRYVEKSLEDSLRVGTRIANQYFTKLWGESKMAAATNHILLVAAIEAGQLEEAKVILGRDLDEFKNEIL